MAVTGPVIASIRDIGIGRVRIVLTDGSSRVTLRAVCERGLCPGTVWRQEWDRCRLVLHDPIDHDWDIPETGKWRQ